MKHHRSHNKVRIRIRVVLRLASKLLALHELHVAKRAV